MVHSSSDLEAMDPAVLEAPYRKSSLLHRRPVHHRVMGTVSIAAVTYFFGCGGPLGSEPIISSTGPAIGLPAMVLYPLLVTGPYAYIVVELCCAFPEDGGFAIWVLNAFGPFWGFQVGYWSWMAGIFNTALLPGFLLQIFNDYYDVSIDSGVTSFCVKVVFALTFTLPSVLGAKVTSRSCIVLLICVLVPVVIFTAWAYSRARDYEDLIEIRHEGIEEYNGDNLQVGETAIDWALLLNTLFWKYDGINIASVFGGEVANPAGVYSRAVALTVALTVLTYLVPMPAAIIVDDPNWTFFTRDSYPAIAESIGGPVLKALFVFSSCCSAVGLFISGIFCEAFQLAVPGGKSTIAAFALLPTVMLCYIVVDAFSSITSALIILGFLVPGLAYGLDIDSVDTAVLDGDVPYRKSDGLPVHHRIMGTTCVVAVTYFFGCGGPLGSEPIISSAGPAIGLPAILLYPLVVLGPYAFIVAELCCAFPEDGGFTVWVLNAFGPFWAFQVGYWSWVAGVFETALLPGFLLELLREYYGVSISSGIVSYGAKVAIALLFTIPCIVGTRVVSRMCVGLLVLVLLPVLVFTVWAYLHARDFGDLFELRHEFNVIDEDLGDDEQTGPLAIDWALLFNTLFWAFDGINMASVFGGEVSNPARVYPRAIAFTLLLTILTYLIPMPAAILVDDPNWTYFTRDSYPALADAIGGPVLKGFTVFSSCCSITGLFVSAIFCKSFQLSGMGDAQLLPSCFARRNRRFDSPHVSIGTTALFTIALLGADFDVLLPMTNAFAGAVQLLIILAAIKLRKLLPYIPRPVRIPGGERTLMALAVLPTLVLCYIVFDTFRSLTSTLIVLVFLLPGVVYAIYNGHRNPALHN
ncbi:hypothetical protein BBO99_00002644 [Phytophthora kernoviae]|uniref:Amino acid permease/ SLC12A domain-containing protein n=2 Tax=Phytophthora kernoviae TaxID=325452 RepID=A0A3R7K456_9STRA|nr:hypothetical protein G195_004558 [Phytophthora kernoviae 00238/432]KAG2526942.1 hypothetical protein JM16_002770 [Phytophthora kernoviae]KAG2528440.1 hypothetical protein JM18_002618 [Phytophthora kernoviae]RLN14151.1 hypothetical protein BBI17_002588 [Phytophthora kernoviae]RLN82766.1 hypothetical protein BBO99_00002644 [Phytophthora kernoviae]